MVRWWSVLASALVAASMLVGAPGLATACACGGVVSMDPSARVADEEALITTDGTTETVVLRLNLESDSDNAALVVPTPTPATVAAASPTLFEELATLSAPRVEVVRHWTLGWGSASSAAEGAAPGATAGAPTVVRQVKLGPLEATTLTGGDLTGVRNWLTTNGYVLRQEISAGLDPYLRDGWSVVAMRLTSDAPLNGPLAPVSLQFASDRLVYPMRMSAEAQGPQTVVTYTLGAHRMQRSDPDAATQPVDVDYAGSITGRTDDSTLTELSANGGYLTKMTTRIYTPAEITSDFEFATAPTDDPFQRVVYRHQNRDATPLLLAGGLAMVVLVVGGLVFLARRRSRQ